MCLAKLLSRNMLACSVRYNGQYIRNTHGSGSGQIWLDNVECTGHEKSFAQCVHAGWGNHNCDHSQDVSVSCFFDASRQYAGQKTPTVIFVLVQSSSSLRSSFANLNVMFTTHHKRRSIANWRCSVSKLPYLRNGAR